MAGTGTGTGPGTVSLSVLVLVVVLCTWLSTGECSTSPPTPTPPPFHYSGGEFSIAGLVSRSTSNDGGILDAIADFQVRSWSLMENQTNAKGGVWINGISYRLKIHAFNVGFGSTPDNITSMVERVNDIIVYQKYGYFPVVLAPFPSDYNLRIAAICDAHHRLLVTIDLSSYIYQCPDPPDLQYGADCISRNLKPGERRYSYVFSTLFSTSKYWNGAIYTLKLAGAQTVALITVPHIQAQSATKGIQEALSNAGMTLVYHYSASINESLSDSIVTNRIIEHLIIHYPSVDVLIVHNDDGSSNTVINSMLKYNFMTKAALFAVPPGHYGTDPLVGGQDSAKYFVSVLQFDPRLQATVSPTTYPNDLYVSSINPTTGLVNSDAAYQAYLSLSRNLDPYSSVFDPLLVVPVLVIKRALDHIRDINYTSIIQGFNCINMTDINQEPCTQVQAQARADLFATQLRTVVQNMYEDSFYGRLQFDAFGRYATDAVVLQAKTAGEYDLVYPLHSATAKFIYPVPTWDERVYQPKYAQTRNERIILAMASVALLILLMLSGAIYWYRKEPQVRAASPRFIQCLLFGCMLMIISIYTWTLYETSASCAAHVWLFSLGYVLMFSPLFAKTWRLWTIFCTRSMQVIPLTDSKLALQGPVPMLLVELCLLIIWHSSAPFHAITVHPDPLRPSSNYDTCYYNHVSEAFFYVSVAYKVVMLLCGCALIWFCRNIPEAYNESPYIAACIYQALITAAILIPIVSTDVLNRDIRFIVRSSGIIGATVLSACTLCIPKLYYVYTARVKSKSQSSHGSGSGCNPLINSTFITTEKHVPGAAAPRKRSTTASTATGSVPTRPQSLLKHHQKKSSFAFVSDIVINKDTDTGTGSGAHPSLTSSPALVNHSLGEKPMQFTGDSAGASNSASASASACTALSLSLSPSPSAPVTYSDILQQAFSMIRQHCSITLENMEHIKYTIQELVQQMEISLLISSAETGTGTETGTADHHHHLNETDHDTGTDHQLDHPNGGDPDMNHSMETSVMPTRMHVNFPQEEEKEQE